MSSATSEQSCVLKLAGYNEVFPSGLDNLGTSSDETEPSTTFPYIGDDEHHKAFKDPLHVPVGPITKVRSKKIKEALNGLIQEIWADSNTGRSKLGPKEDEGVIHIIQAIEG